MKKFLIVLIVIVLGVAGYIFISNNIYNLIGKDYNEFIAQDYNGVDIDNIDQYDIYVKFDPNKRLCVVNQKVKYINKENISLNNIYFHIYPNAFKTNTMYIGEKSVDDDNYEPGYIDIKTIK
jgi:hypothetical protein